MTLRDIKSWLGDFVGDRLSELGSVVNTSILDWPIWVVIFVAVVALIAFLRLARLWFSVEFFLNEKFGKGATALWAWATIIVFIFVVALFKTYG